VASLGCWVFATILVKVGGSVIRKGIDNLLDEMSQIYDKFSIVLIHGGGWFVTEIMEKMNVKPIFVKSPSGVISRYTDWNTLQCYVMAMMWINKQLVSRLQKLGVKAIGLSGADAGLLKAKRKDRIIIVDERGRQRVIDGGFTGKITEVNVEIINKLVSNGYLPVIAPIAIDSDGNLLNVDSDQVVTTIAQSLKPRHVIILSDVDGLIINNEVVKRLTCEEAYQLFHSEQVQGGMKRKLYMCAEMAKCGCEVIIANGTIERPITSALNGLGTHIEPITKNLNPQH